MVSLIFSYIGNVFCFLVAFLLVIAADKVLMEEEWLAAIIFLVVGSIMATLTVEQFGDFKEKLARYKKKKDEEYWKAVEERSGKGKRRKPRRV